MAASYCQNRFIKSREVSCQPTPINYSSFFYVFYVASALTCPFFVPMFACSETMFVCSTGCPSCNEVNVYQLLKSRPRTYCPVIIKSFSSTRPISKSQRHYPFRLSSQSRNDYTRSDVVERQWCTQSIRQIQ